MNKTQKISVLVMAAFAAIMFAGPIAMNSAFADHDDHHHHHHHHVVIIIIHHHHHHHHHHFFHHHDRF